MTLFCSAREFHNLCRDLASRADVVRLQAKGGSMYPFIKSGDWVEVAFCRDGKMGVAKGDVILFERAGALYMHRAIGVHDGRIVMKGDQSFGTDGTIPMEDVLGKAVSVHRNGRMIDLNAAPSRFISAVIADGAVVFQYLFLLARKIAGAGLALIYWIQSFGIYRQIAKMASKTDVIIREARPDDAEAIRDLFIMGGHDVKKDIIDIKKEGFWLVAERRRKIVAGLTVTRYEKDPKLWVIFGLEVKPLLRGAGIGRRIVERALILAGESGAEEIGLFVNKRSRPALCLYNKLGFTASKSFPSEFNRSPDETYLSYTLKAAA